MPAVLAVSAPEYTTPPDGPATSMRRRTPAPAPSAAPCTVTAASGEYTGLLTLADRPVTPTGSAAGPPTPSPPPCSAAGTCGGLTTSKWTVPRRAPPCDADTVYLPGLESAPVGNGLSS